MVALMKSALLQVGMPSRLGREPRQLTCWTPSAQGLSKLNSDGARAIATGIARCGGLVRDAAGHWIFGYNKALGVCSALEAELWGVYIGLFLAWRMHLRRVVIELDSIEAIRHIQDERCGVGSPGIILHIKDLCTRSWTLSFQHINREGNKVADRLARLNQCVSLEVQEFPDPPLEVVHLLQEDVGD
ncbi:hypothetical protein GQ457_09G002620 [Hibiscus cannabinus]